MSQVQKKLQDTSLSAFEEAEKEGQPSLMKELWLYIIENKSWWMIPIVLALALVGLLVLLGSTGAAPFIYTIF